MTARNIRSAVVATIIGLCAAVLLAGPAEANSPKIPKHRSGLPWASGASMADQTPAGHNWFGRYRKAKTDLAMTYTGRSSWPEIVNPAWLYAEWKDAPHTLVISLAPFPEQPEYSLRACARGDYDIRWRRFGRNIAKTGLASRTIVRLAWEFNGDWQQWAARKPADFVGCWRHVFRAAESVAPGLRWDWTVNRGNSENVMSDPRKAWPGRKYVDYVGIDSYDGWPPVRGKIGWNAQYAGAYGLKFWADFARSKNRQLSVPEWGMFRGSAWAGHSGGDNPYYIRKMFGFFKEQRGNLAYETYFNDEDPEHLTALTVNPRGAAEYRRQIKQAKAAR